MTGPGHGGRVGSTGSSLLTQYLLKVRSLGLLVAVMYWNLVVVCVFAASWDDKRDVDGKNPREAILKYAQVAVKDLKFIAPAYSETQPKTIFAKSDDDKEEKDYVKI